jgi:hypothetical protein
VARGDIVVAAGTHRQVNDVLGFLGAGDVGVAALEVEVHSQARVIVYGSVVDNLSSDPIFVPGLRPDTGLPWQHDAGRFLDVPAAAATAGYHGTRWRTDVRALMPDEPDPVVEVTFTPHSGDPPATSSFAAGRGGLLVLDDVVTQLGAGGSGVLELVCPAGSMLATTRTYTTSPGGTYGQFIPALSTLVNLHRGTVLGLRGDERFRSNVGIVNPGARAARVTLELRTSANELLATRTEVIGPGAAVQINDVFGHLGVEGCAACRLDYRAESDGSGANVVVYGSVIDNSSGDPVFIPAQSF